MIKAPENQNGVDIVASGTGALLVATLSCLRTLVTLFLSLGIPINRLIGTSGGGIAIAWVAHGKSFDDGFALLKRLLTKWKLLDLSWWPPTRAGFFNGDVLYKALKQEFPGKMGDAKIPWGVYVVNTDTEETVLLSSWGTPNVKTADALRATAALTFAFKLHPVPGVGLCSDGGLTVNFGMSACDTQINGEPSEVPTIGIRIADVPPPKKKVTGFVGLILKLVRIWLRAATNGHVSSKRYADVVNIKTDVDALDFDMDHREFEKQVDDGDKAAWEFLRDSQERLFPNAEAPKR
jgi:predicted acylesterase/phospholipase RssA